MTRSRDPLHRGAQTLDLMMTNEIIESPVELEAVPDRAWTAAMEADTEEEGYFHRIGQQHWAFFADRGPALLVSFECAEAIRERPDQLPFAHDLAKRNGWSHLCLIADGATWFRDKAVYSFFDRQIDDAFFEDFDRVLFYGAGMCGYAACAYAVCAPGAQVLALNPRATLAPSQAGWDRRDLAARKLDFTTRFGYAPDMLEGVANAAVVHDPTIAEEAMHAALFRARHVTQLSARHLGENLEYQFSQMGILTEMIEVAMSGRFDAQRFARMWRKRRDHMSYLNALLAKTAEAGQETREMMVLRSVTSRLKVPRLEKRLTRLAASKAAAEDGMQAAAQ